MAHGVRGTAGDELFDDAGQRRIAIGFFSGSTPALQFFDAAGNQRILIDGVAVLQTFSDGTRDRVQLGNLPAYTDPAGVASPAGYGGRSVDASGNLLWDTSGVTGQAVMKSLGVVDASGGQSFTTTGFTAVTGTTINFTTTRQGNIMALFLATGSVSAAGNVGFIRANLVGVTTSGNCNFGPVNAITSMGWLFAPNLAAGSYAMRLDGAVNNTPQTFTIVEAALQVFQLGG